MTADPRLVELSATYKTALLEFIQKPRYQRELRLVIDETFGFEEPDEGELINTFDYFMLEYQFPDGRTVIDDFLKAHRRLPIAEREMLLGWKGVIEAILRAERIDGEALIATNLVDDLTYRVRANIGAQFFDRTPPGSFLATRLTPLQDEWVISGATTLLAKSESIRAFGMAQQAQLTRPDLVFRNPAKVEQGWELQRQDREAFIGFFGADLVVLPSNELIDRYEEYLLFKVDYSALADKPDLPAFDALLNLMRGIISPDVETFGMSYDAVEGFALYVDFALFEEAFANPDLAASGQHRKLLRHYLRNGSISPLPFRRMVERYPEHADRVFQTLLRKPAFSWQRDGEALLRRHKRAYFETPPLPSVVPTGFSRGPDASGRLLSSMQDAVWREA